MGKNISYKRRGFNITLLIQDENWNKIGSWKWNDKDQKNKAKVLKTLKEVYGITFKPTIDSDLDWLR